MMKRLPQASASLRKPEKSAPETVAAALTSMPTTWPRKRAQELGHLPDVLNVRYIAHIALDDAEPRR
jgi:hypothetical protein